MEIWAVLMVVTGGMFAGGAATFSWSRVPRWRAMPIADFGEDFGWTLRRTDKVQPALLVVAIASSIGFALVADGSAAVVASIAAVGFVVTLAASVAVLVPLQRRIVVLASTQDPSVEEMRRRWFRGHLGRSALSTASFVSTALAVVV